MSGSGAYITGLLKNQTQKLFRETFTPTQDLSKFPKLHIGSEKLDQGLKISANISMLCLSIFLLVGIFKVLIAKSSLSFNLAAITDVNIAHVIILALFLLTGLVSLLLTAVVLMRFIRTIHLFALIGFFKTAHTLIDKTIPQLLYVQTWDDFLCALSTLHNVLL